MRSYIELNDIEYWGSERKDNPYSGGHGFYIYEIPSFIQGGLCKLKMFPVTASNGFLKPMVPSITSIDMGYFSRTPEMCFSVSWSSYFEISGDVSNPELVKIKEILEKHPNIKPLMDDNAIITNIIGAEFHGKKRKVAIGMVSPKNGRRHVIELLNGQVIDIRKNLQHP